MAETADFSMSLGTSLLTDKEGSVTWHYFNSLEGLGLVLSSTDINKIIAALPDKSTLTLVIETQSLALPEKSGLLEIRKSTNDFVTCLFTTLTGSYTGVSVNGAFKGWMSTAGGSLPTGSIVAYSSVNAPPTGWLSCDGKSYVKTTYPGLYAIIGATWGDNGTTFNVPDLRGRFIRGWDSTRDFGSLQESGAPNITGTGPMEGDGSSHNFSSVGGAFYNIPFSDKITVGGGGAWYGNIVGIDASRCSNVYQNGLTEVRPINIAVQYIIKY